MRLIFAGTPEAAVPSLRALAASHHDLALVLTRPDAPVGRGRTLTPSAVALTADELGLAVLKTDRINDPEVATALRKISPDVAVIVAYGGLIKEPLLSAWPWVNLHFSLLPAYRGAAPVQHALLAGETITGVSTFLLNEGMDTGPLLGQATELIHTEETSGTLLHRLSLTGADLLAATLDRWSELQPAPQRADGVSLAPKISTDMARIDWTSSAELLERHIRAMNPQPGAWCLRGSDRLVIEMARLTTDHLLPGEVHIGKNSVFVGTGSTALELLIVKPEGKRAMPASDWARGLRAVERLS